MKKKESKKSLVFDYVPNMNSTATMNVPMDKLKPMSAALIKPIGMDGTIVHFSDSNADNNEVELIIEFYQNYPDEYIEFLIKQKEELIQFIKNFKKSEVDVYP